MNYQQIFWRNYVIFAICQIFDEQFSNPLLHIDFFNEINVGENCMYLFNASTFIFSTGAYSQSMDEKLWKTSHLSRFGK